MRISRLSIAALLVGGAMFYVALGEHKAIGIMAGIVAVIAARFIIPDLRNPSRNDDSAQDDQ